MTYISQAFSLRSNASKFIKNSPSMKRKWKVIFLFAPELRLGLGMTKALDWESDVISRYENEFRNILSFMACSTNIPNLDANNLQIFYVLMAVRALLAN